MTERIEHFTLTPSGTDEYPGDGLRLTSAHHAAVVETVCDTSLLRHMGYNDLRSGDEVTITVKVRRLQSSTIWKPVE